MYLLTFIEFLRVILINVVIGILMVPTKLATPGLLEITAFLNKGYDVTISVHNVINEILSRDSNYFVNVLM